MRALKAKGVEVELRPERKTQAMMNGFNLLNGEILLFIPFFLLVYLMVNIILLLYVY